MRFKIMAKPDILIIERMSKIGPLPKMASLVGISRQQISYIENRRRGTSHDTARKIADLLEMKVDDLFEINKGGYDGR